MSAAPTQQQQKKRKTRATTESSPSHFSFDMDTPFTANRNFVHFVIQGRPLPFKRPGFGWNKRRYNANKGEQAVFVRTMLSLFEAHDAELIHFDRSCEIDVKLVYFLPGSVTTRPPDVDNLAKFTLDALQGAGIFPNDCQVTKLLAEKRLCSTNKRAASNGATEITVAKKVIEID